MEFRKDPVVERWVIIAPGRSARPHEYCETESIRRRGDCPFCGGNEALTTPEIGALREPGTSPTGPGWRVRAVLNKYPFLDSSEPRTSVSGRLEPLTDVRGSDLFRSQPATGPHEVLIDSPRHVVRGSELSNAETVDVLRLYQARLSALRADPHVRFVQIFKNVGEAAGASIEHLHSQLAALAVVPPDVAAEVAALRTYRDAHGRCAYCDVLAAELAEGERIVETTPNFVVLCPYASGFSYEMQIMPRRHVAAFENTDDAGLVELAELLRRAVLRLEAVVARPAYNLLMKTEPFDSFGEYYYHWRITIWPRLNKAAGFEWATGILVNPVAPEEAAKALREAILERPK